MPTSSTGAIYSSSSPIFLLMENLDNGNEFQAALDDSARSASLAGIPDYPTESINRFLNNDSSSNPEIAAEYQSLPIEFRESQDEIETETQARVRMLAQLHAFDKKSALINVVIAVTQQ
ncbi:hypothetical protein J3E69DRAFT_356162 [Trichoderma sp. SZMC 28015]